jgi:signal peptidase I
MMGDVLGVRFVNPKEHTMKLVVTTQYRENYGYRWKFKGGDIIIVENVTLDTIKELAEEVTKEVEFSNDAASNEVIEWFAMGDAEEYPDYFYGITILTKKEGKWEGTYCDLTKSHV